MPPMGIGKCRKRKQDSIAESTGEPESGETEKNGKTWPIVAGIAAAVAVIAGICAAVIVKKKKK